MNRVRSSVLFSITDKYLTQIILLITTAIMSRLLTPAETGLFLVANTVILLADNLRTFGVGVYIVQEPELRREAIRTAFTLTMLLSLLMMLAIYLGANEIARFYGEPALGDLLRTASLGFIIIPFASPILALLQREFAFKTLAAINVCAALTNSAVSIALGAAGAGPQSYVWGFVASAAALVLFAFLARPEAWIYRPSLAGARSLVSFGAVSSSVTVINMAYELLPRLAFGKLLSFEAVGLYARAVTICQLPDRAIVSALHPVVLPAMAARSRAGGDLKHFYLKGHALLSAIQWPALIMVALLADPIVRILLGAQWEAAAPLVQLMALANMALAPAFMTFPLLVAVGRIRDTLVLSLISLPPSILIMIGAATFGVQEAAASLLVVAPMQMLVALVFIRRAIGLTFAELAAASRASLFLAAATALGPATVVLLSPSGFALGWTDTAVALLAGACGWTVAILLVEHPVKNEFARAARIFANLPAGRRLGLKSPSAATRANTALAERF